MKENAYFTVEAAMVLPVAMCTMIFVVYMLLFQYDRCLMEQDMGAMAMWGCCQEADGMGLSKEKAQERVAGLYRGKYLAWDITELDISLEKNCFSVKGTGKLTFPMPELNFWSAEDIWGMEADYSFRRLSPVAFIRLCKRVRGRGGEADPAQDGTAAPE